MSSPERATRGSLVSHRQAPKLTQGLFKIHCASFAILHRIQSPRPGGTGWAASATISQCSVVFNPLIRKLRTERFRLASVPPEDRLNRLCDAMIKALEEHPERGEERCVIFLQDGELSGIVVHGYEDDTEAVADLLRHLRAVFPWPD